MPPTPLGVVSKYVVIFHGPLEGRTSWPDMVPEFDKTFKELWDSESFRLECLNWSASVSQSRRTWLPFVHHTLETGFVTRMVGEGVGDTVGAVEHWCVLQRLLSTRYGQREPA
jgi:hypothetical protein